MLNKLRAETKLYILVSVMTCLMIGIGFYGIREIRSLNQEIHTLYEDRVFPLNELADIRFSYDDILVLANEGNNGETDFNKLQKGIEEDQRNINRNWNSYLKTYLTPEEKTLAEETGQLIVRSNVTIERLKNAAVNKNQTIFKQLSGANLSAELMPVKIKITSLMALQVKVSGGLNAESTERYHLAIRNFIWLISISILISGILAFFLIKNIKKFIRRLRERNLRIKETEEKYRYLFNNSPAYIIIWDLEDLCVLEVNDAVIDRYGYSREEWTGMPVYNYRPAADHSKIREFAKKMLKSEDKTISKMWTHLKKGGEEMLMEITSHKITYNNRPAILSLANDVTDLKRALNNVEMNQERLLRVMQNSPVAMAITDSTQKVSFYNKRFTEVFGYTMADVPTTADFWRLAYPDETYRKDVRDEWLIRIGTASLNNARFEPMEAKVCCKDGTFRIIEFDFANLGDESLIIFHDITERKHAEEKLKTSQERYQSIISVSNTGAWEYHGDSGYLWCSAEYFSMLGRNKEDYDLSGKNNLEETWLDLLHPEDRERANMHFALYLENGSVGTYENYFRMQHINGDWVWIWSRGQTLRESNGKLTDITVGTHIDITKRVLIEKEMTHREEKNRALIENISDTIILLNNKFEVVYLSPSHMRTAGFSEEAYEGKTALDFIHPDDLELCKNALKESQRTVGVPLQIQFRTLHHSGHYIWVEGTINNQLQNESVGNYVINYRDITERKKLEEQQLLITSIVNSSDDGIISKTLDGTVTSWNKGAEHILGYSAEEIIGKKLSVIIPSEFLQEEVEIINKIKAGQSVDHFETQRRKKNGELIYVSLTISPIIDSDGNITGASKIMRDIGYRKSMEMERERTITDLSQRNRDLEQFSYIVSHNLRGPVATIIGLAGLMNEIGSDENERKTITEGISVTVNKLDTVIKDLNNILHIKRAIDEKKENVILSDLLEEVVGTLKGLQENVQMTLHSDFVAVNEIITLKSYMHSIFYNLISNSIKYRQSNVQPVIQVKSELLGNKVKLIFKDNGLGIDLAVKQEQVFGLYKRFHRHIEGKGMGLFMVKTQVEALGGRISIQSEVNKGTEFILEFEIHN